MSWMKVLKYVGGSIIEMPLEIIGRQLEFYQQRKNAAHEQQLRQEEMRFQQQLELDNRKLNAEIDDMIANNEIELSSQRARAFTEAVANHKRTMAECNVSIANSLGNMNIDLYDRASALAKEKTESYMALQERALNNAYDQFDKIHAKFPEGSRARAIMEDAVAKQINSIIETSDRFIQTIANEFAELTKSIRQITDSTNKNTEQYLSPVFGNNTMLQDSGNTKLLK